MSDDCPKHYEGTWSGEISALRTERDALAAGLEISRMSFAGALNAIAALKTRAEQAEARVAQLEAHNALLKEADKAGSAAYISSYNDRVLLETRVQKLTELVERIQRSWASDKLLMNVIDATLPAPVPAVPVVCGQCNGQGWYAEGSTDKPQQRQCELCYGTGFTNPQPAPPHDA